MSQPSKIVIAFGIRATGFRKGGKLASSSNIVKSERYAHHQCYTKPIDDCQVLGREEVWN